MLKQIFEKIFGSANSRLLKSYKKDIDKINSLSSKYEKMSNEELKKQTSVLKKRLQNDEKEENIIHDAFAIVREAGKRVLNLRHFDVQLIGGLVLIKNQIAEMKTGEGKTLVATLALYLKALHEKGAHLITVNDYLAHRDAEWMGKIYTFLGMTIGIIQHDMPDEERKKAYNCDITYVTNSELGFDYLRDNMKYSKEDQVLRPLYYAIVDEVDSILIDEARTPLIISGPAEDSSEMYEKVNRVVVKLRDDDFKIDEKDKHVTLTDKGVDVATNLLKQEGILIGDNLYSVDNSILVMHIQQSLMAQKLYFKNVNYVVKNGEVLIVDEFTGRVMTGRRFGRGLHQAIEAKEGVRIMPENQTISSISYQNLFRLYPNLAGMTGTAMTEAPEFEEIYNLRVVSIPTNVPIKRIDHNDEIYRNKTEKYNAIVKQIKTCVDKNQPVLIGTVSIEKSEELASYVQKKLNIKPSVLNAKNHEKEAEIIAQAGAPGAITIATNMAGRGTDIKLGGNAESLISKLDSESDNFEKDKIEILKRIAIDKQKVIDAGGLYVIGTERHESRRIDNQLRGRSGRQGDPGDSKFFLALDDDLMRIFGATRLDSMLSTFGLKEGEAIVHPWITKALEKAQKRVETRYFEARKELLKYDNVMNEQRTIIYEKRNSIMNSDNLDKNVNGIIEDVIEMICERAIPEKSHVDDWNIDFIHNEVLKIFALDITDLSNWKQDENITEQKAYDMLIKLTKIQYQNKKNSYDIKIFNDALKQVLLNSIDVVWKKHLGQMDYLQTGIGLRGYGQKNPLYEYKQEAFGLFNNTINNFKIIALANIYHMEININNYQQNDNLEIGRNELCPCGSGLKYKHCCGKIK